jgi:dTDP-4-amino-4,6-dideoxygalactose transaminase
MIPFNKPHLTGREAHYLYQAVLSGKLSGNGVYTRKTQATFCSRYGFLKTLLTTSCTDALEMCALLADIQPGDEVIMPSYTFVSTANAFVLRGARIRFVDSLASHPNLDHAQVEELITPRTKAIVAMHYAGVACDMGALCEIATTHGLLLIEDAAQAVDSFYNKKPLGGIGALGAFSFHETKNIISGEGGMLTVNDPRFAERAEIIWEKGTNRSAFFRGEVDKYGWVDIGSSFLPSEIVASFLYAQVEEIDDIQTRRIALWNRYNAAFTELAVQGIISLPHIPEWATNNGHLFYLLCGSDEERDRLIKYLREKEIQAVFHYLPLHQSSYFEGRHDGRVLPQAERYAKTLVRLPLYYDLQPEEQDSVIEAVREFYEQVKPA